MGNCESSVLRNSIWRDHGWDSLTYLYVCCSLIFGFNVWHSLDDFYPKLNPGVSVNY